MAKVRCTIQNASNLIKGIEFNGPAGNKVSDEITSDLAAHFARVPGFEVIDSETFADDLLANDADIEPVADKPKRGRKKTVIAE